MRLQWMHILGFAVLYLHLYFCSTTVSFEKKNRSTSYQRVATQRIACFKICCPRPRPLSSWHRQWVKKRTERVCLHNSEENGRRVRDWVRFRCRISSQKELYLSGMELFWIFHHRHGPNKHNLQTLQRRTFENERWQHATAHPHCQSDASDGISLKYMCFNETVLTYCEWQRVVQRRRPPLLYSLAESLFERGFAAMSRPPNTFLIIYLFDWFRLCRNAMADAPYEDSISRSIASHRSLVGSVDELL